MERPYEKWEVRDYLDLLDILWIPPREQVDIAFRIMTLELLGQPE